MLGKKGAEDGQALLCSICSGEDYVLVCCGEERVESKGETLLSVHTLTHGHELWIVTKRKRL